jgi:DNA mismatch endonuclease (patch repair protein)
MSDIHDTETRSYNMSRIRSKDTKPEILVRKYLFSKGLRYRLHSTKYPGKPDILLPKYKTAIFVHGCFWHGHEGCKYFVVPQTRKSFWADKIEKNKARDKKNIIEIKKKGWNVIIVYECELRSDKKQKTFVKVLNKVKNTVS